ncbi:uncharacterized protein BJ171DRAFT_487231 [Polychytrium aggregatum]|uniref:uncharacterized protein n=1 Tax=Polychytrium aggregatum TaxID=110093 RepID=UPI0022FEF502|nr:uncharacterized protein BJ171DRAFT_487231 [Polychytrium aggregatum]KAI9209513.1 hypothetical protein BJ171DRAFT_487231 [Polychytrium aggregatum]
MSTEESSLPLCSAPYPIAAFDFDDVLQLILTRVATGADLMGCLLVSRRWYAAALPVLYRHPLLASPQALCAFVIVLRQHPLRSAFLSSLSFAVPPGQPSWLRDKDLATLFAALRRSDSPSLNVRHVSFKGCRGITGRSLQHLPLLFPSLTSVDLQGCVGISSSLPIMLVRSLRDLSRLILSASCAVPLCDLPALMTPKMQDLDVVIHHSPYSSIAWLMHPPMPPSHSTDTQPRALQRLALTRQEIITNQGMLPDEALTSLLRMNPTITDLDLRWNAQLTWCSLRDIVLCSGLQRLSLDFCSQLCDDTLLHIGRGCQRLRHLSLSHCRLITDAGISYAAQTLRSLETIDMDGIAHLTDTAAAVWTAHDHIRGISMARCPNLTNRSLLALAQVRNLCTLNIADCPQISWPQAPEPPTCCFRALRTITVDAKAHTVENALGILSKCPALETIVVKGRMGTRPNLSSLRNGSLSRVAVEYI